MTQWHPIFAQLLRPVVEAWYDVQTTVPVGDAPREADFVLLRRTGTSPLPFRGLWRHLTTWNILEFKGPSVSPRRGDVDLLIELGLGIDRRLQEERTRQREQQLPPGEVSFWYLANRLGRRFLADAERKLRGIDALGPGLWRSRIVDRLIFLVSSIDLPVEEDSLPLHVVGQEPLATERQVARLVLDQPDLQEQYSGWLASLHPIAWREIEAMARTASRKLKLDLLPAIDYLGLPEVIRQVGAKRVADALGVEGFIEQIGPKQVSKQLGIDRFLASLSPADRRELKRRLVAGQ